MNKQITLGQMLSSIVALVVAIVGGWILLKTEVATLQSNQVQTERRVEQVESKIKSEDIERAIDRKESQQQREEMLRLLYDIKIELEKKKNR